MVWYSHLFKNFPHFVVIHTTKQSKASRCSTGFRKGRGTRDQIANICWIIEKTKEFQKNIYFCFIDYAKAFDCVDQNKMWKISKEVLSINKKLIYDKGIIQIHHYYSIGNLISDLQPCGHQDVVIRASLVAQTVKNLPEIQETCIQSLGWNDPLEKEMATHFSIPA